MARYYISQPGRSTSNRILFFASEFARQGIIQTVFLHSYQNYFTPINIIKQYYISISNTFFIASQNTQACRRSGAGVLECVKHFHTEEHIGPTAVMARGYGHKAAFSRFDNGLALFDRLESVQGGIIVEQITDVGAAYIKGEWTCLDKY